MKLRRRIFAILLLFYMVTMGFSAIPNDILSGSLLRLQDQAKYLLIEQIKVPSSVELFKYGRNFSDYFVKAYCIDIQGVDVHGKEHKLDLYRFRCPKRTPTYKWVDYHRTVFYYNYSVFIGTSLKGYPSSRFYMIEGPSDQVQSGLVNAFAYPFCRQYGFESVEVRLRRIFKSFTSDEVIEDTALSERVECKLFRNP